MKFDEIMALFQIGATIAKENIPVPGLALGIDAATVLTKVAHDAFVSGRNRGEWTDAQCAKFDTEILPKLVVQDHWMKADPAAPPPPPAD